MKNVGAYIRYITKTYYRTFIGLSESRKDKCYCCWVVYLTNFYNSLTTCKYPLSQMIVFISRKFENCTYELWKASWLQFQRVPELYRGFNTIKIYKKSQLVASMHLALTHNTYACFFCSHEPVLLKKYWLLTVTF